MNDRHERRLLILGSAFLFLYSIILTLSPSVREHSWAVSYRLSHWIGFLVWLVSVFITYRLISQKLQEHDPFLFPFSSLLSGWGLLTIWRLDSDFGLRQALWLVISLAALIGMLYIPRDINILRRYKYLLLTTVLILTAMTLFLGTNPSGFGPRLWLGFGGFYLQPSEPLKLLLVVYLSAYFADRFPIQLQEIPILLPSIFVTGVALVLLIVQRDLGTASILILLYTTILFIATDKRRVLIGSAVGLFLAGIIGFFFINIVHARIESWINPWNDPSGRSYQIVQSLLAIANGGIFGRGPGLGSPSLVPVAHSDFIFTAIAEETGLIGTIGLMAIFALISGRGLSAALNASDRYQRLLASGLTAYLGIQAMIIIGGNLRLFPLTGVTLPFVSYGGSSLLTSFIALALLLAISNKTDKEPTVLLSRRPYFRLAFLLGSGLIAAAFVNSWWSVIRSPDLLNRTDNPRRSISDRYVLRGEIVDRNNQPIDVTQGKSGSYQRLYLYPQLASITGYTHPVYGQAGLEASLDDYLRGLQGNPTSTIFWDQLLYGTPPPGLDIRLSLDLDLQKEADLLLGSNKGAIALINARSGEILILASHPTFNPNQLNETGSSLVQDTNSPLIDRATQGMYPIGSALNPIFKFALNTNHPTESDLLNLYTILGFYLTPQIRLPVAVPDTVANTNNLHISPLQMAIAWASLSNNGIRPAPRIALAVDTHQQGWVVLPALGSPDNVFSPILANTITMALVTQNQPFWEWTAKAQSNQETNTWYMAGTLPNWHGTPLALVILLEGDDEITAQSIGRQLIQKSINSNR